MKTLRLLSLAALLATGTATATLAAGGGNLDQPNVQTMQQSENPRTGAQVPTNRSGTQSGMLTPNAGQRLEMNNPASGGGNDNSNSSSSGAGSAGSGGSGTSR